MFNEYMRIVCCVAVFWIFLPTFRENTLLLTLSWMSFFMWQQPLLGVRTLDQP